VAEKLLDTLPAPPGPKAAITLWNGLLNCVVKTALQSLRPSAVTPDITKDPRDWPAARFTKENGDGLGVTGGPGVHNCPSAAGVAKQPAAVKDPLKNSVRFSIGNAGAASKLTKGTGGEKGALGLKTGAEARFKSKIVTVVPSSATNEPLKGIPPIPALSAGVPGPVLAQLIVVFVTVTVPAIVNCPKSGDADKVVLQVTANNVTNNSLPIPLSHITVVSSLIVQLCAILDPNSSFSRVSSASTVVIVL
jgi:hypothetical protein